MALGYQPAPRYNPSGIDPMILMLLAQQGQQKGGVGGQDWTSPLLNRIDAHYGLSGGGGAAAPVFSATAPEAAADAYISGLNLGGGAPATPNVVSVGRVGADPTSFFTGNNLLGPGPMGVGDYLPGVAGLAGAYDLLSKKKHGWSGAGQGAMSGAGIGWTLGGPAGAGIGAGIGAITGYFGNFGDKDRWRTEGKRLDKLTSQGIRIPESMLGATRLTKGRSKSELIQENVTARLARGEISPEEAERRRLFETTRDEKYLTPKDIIGNATFFERYGNDWLGKMSDEDRTRIAQKALDSGAVREHHGTIDVDWNKVDTPQSGVATLSSDIPATMTPRLVDTPQDSLAQRLTKIPSLRGKMNRG